MYGTTNEYLIFPIINLINKELRKGIQSGNFDNIIRNASDRGIPGEGTQESNNVVYDGGVLATLQSNDYELTLEKNNPDNPNMLTGVTIEYGKTLKQVISLIRENGKLSFVKVVVISREPIDEVTSNPYGMSGFDFREYVFNKRKIIYYTGISNDLTKPQIERDEAAAEVTLLDVRNTQLRDLYMVSETMDLPYERLLEYLPNPLAMDKRDFVAYMTNMRIIIREYQPSEDIIDSMVDIAESANEVFRFNYFVDDIYTYQELKPFLPNPPGMHGEDYTIFIDNKIEWLRLEESIIEWETELATTTDQDRVNELNSLIVTAEEQQGLLATENQSLRKKYLAYMDGIITGYDESDLDLLISYLPKDSSTYNELVLFKVIISLIYNNEGKLVNVKSATEGG